MRSQVLVACASIEYRIHHRESQAWSLLGEKEERKGRLKAIICVKRIS